MTDESSAEEITTTVGNDAMTHATLIWEAERGGSDARKRFAFAREALSQAEETLKAHPDAVFQYKGSELFLRAAAEYLRKTITRSEELYGK